MLYNDKAVLENHHVSAAFKVMRDDECNIVANLKNDDYRWARVVGVQTGFILPV